MLVIRQKLITRFDIQANRNCLYIFGDNLDRNGYGGQAKEMRGEPNSFGIATKRKAAHGTRDCYFYDSDIDAVHLIDKEFEALQAELITEDMFGIYRKYKAIILPLDGIGTGLSRLPEYAPQLLAYINKRLESL